VLRLREGSEGLPNVPKGDLGEAEALLKPLRSTIVYSHQLKEQRFWYHLILWGFATCRTTVNPGFWVLYKYGRRGLNLIY
jgi:hypothetical protein